MKFHYFLIYLIIVNVIAFFIAAIDKYLAKKKLKRVSEKSLFTIALIGGALCMYISMRTFRHKTRHKSFMIGLPCIIILQIALIFICNYYSILY